ncbi:MAG: hypothetical protein FJ405_12375, partial [Verrucomicrobia bacterium]|nr:hypothetical protein [Verrucomicrobiota bacterium]
MSVQTGGSDSFAPVFSPDSKRIVFLSRAKNLVRPNNAELWTDVYSTTPEAGGI